MISAAFVFALALSSTFASQAEVEQLTDKISGKVASDLADVARDSGRVDPLELNNRLLRTLREDLARLEPQLRQLYTAIDEVGGSVDVLARTLALKINQDPAFNDPIVWDGKIQPRFIGALALGITQVVTDVVKMGLTRY